MVLNTVSQILILVFVKNFAIYLLTLIIFAIVENIAINILINQKYDYIKNLKDAKPIPTEIKKDIMTKVKGLLFHKIGEFIVLGTDNIIISMTMNKNIH